MVLPLILTRKGGIEMEGSDPELPTEVRMCPKCRIAGRIWKCPFCDIPTVGGGGGRYDDGRDASPRRRDKFMGHTGMPFVSGGRMS